jgi:hypothetical protein
MDDVEAGLSRQRRGQVDLIWHDAFSPRHCPQLWTVELLEAATALFAPRGRWISFSSAAAVRDTLRQLGLQLVALERPASATPSAWSGGTLASPLALESQPPAAHGGQPLWRPLTPMEHDHLASAAGEPYRDPTGTADAATILANRLAAQAEALASGRRLASSAWRRRCLGKPSAVSAIPPLKRAQEP